MTRTPDTAGLARLANAAGTVVNPATEAGLQALAAATIAFDIAPSDAVALPQGVRAIYVGGEGHIALKMPAGNTVTLRNVPIGALIPIAPTHVLATGTTASSLVGLA